MMETTKGSRREVTLPAAALLDVLALARDAGDDALRERAHAAGRALGERLSSGQDQDSPRALPLDVFWKRVADLFGSRGWGTFEHAPGAAGVGELRSGDWIEADRPGAGGSCAFGAGMIEGLLEGVSGKRLVVEEAECRAEGAPVCRFLFGSPAAVSRSRQSARASVGAA